MSLINKLISKFKTKNEFVFENFEDNFKSNQRLENKYFKNFSKDSRVILSREETSFYINDVYEDFGNLEIVMFNQVEAGALSRNFANYITFARLYAVNYMGTDQGKTYNEIKRACQCLLGMIDCINFNYISHINCETVFNVEYSDGAFTLTKDEYPTSLIKMVNFANTQISKLAQGIYDRNRNDVYSAYCELSDNDNFVLSKYIDVKEENEAKVQETNSNSTQKQTLNQDETKQNNIENKELGL